MVSHQARGTGPFPVRAGAKAITGHIAAIESDGPAGAGRIVTCGRAVPHGPSDSVTSLHFAAMRPWPDSVRLWRANDIRVPPATCRLVTEGLPLQVRIPQAPIELAGQFFRRLIENIHGLRQTVPYHAQCLLRLLRVGVIDGVLEIPE